MPNLGKTEVVQCDICKTIHKINDNSGYIEIHGNITIGSSGGIIGNNFDDNGICNRTFVTCNTTECLTKLFRMIDCTNKVAFAELYGNR